MITQDQARAYLKELKENYGLTFTEIAEMTDISRSHLSAFIKEKTNLKRKKLQSLEIFIKSYRKEYLNA